MWGPCQRTIQVNCPRTLGNWSGVFTNTSHCSSYNIICVSGRVQESAAQRGDAPCEPCQDPRCREGSLRWVVNGQPLSGDRQQRSTRRHYLPLHSVPSAHSLLHTVPHPRPVRGHASRGQFQASHGPTAPTDTHPHLQYERLAGCPGPWHVRYLPPHLPSRYRSLTCSHLPQTAVTRHTPPK